jgi:hypothetical protein
LKGNANIKENDEKPSKENVTVKKKNGWKKNDENGNAWSGKGKNGKDKSGNGGKSSCLLWQLSITISSSAWNMPKREWQIARIHGYQ